MHDTDDCIAEVGHVLEISWTAGDIEESIWVLMFHEASSKEVHHGGNVGEKRQHDRLLSLTRGFSMRDSRRLVNEESSEEKAGGRWLHQRVYREVARGFVQCLFGGHW